MQKEWCFAQTAGSELRRARCGVPRATHGFTLLELLISMTILALIFVAVLGAIQIGTKSWESGEQRVEENQRTRTLIDSLARELAMIYPLRIQEQDKDVVIFHGKSDTLEFATLPQIYGAEPFSHMLRIVTYAVEPDRGLVATASYPLVGSASTPIEGRAKPLDERVSQVSFRYLVPDGSPQDKRPPVWRDAWDPSKEDAPFLQSMAFLPAAGQRGLRGSARLPFAVEITLTIRPTKQRGDHDVTLPPMIFPVQVGRTL